MRELNRCVRSISRKKVTQASINLIDTPGLSRDHEGSAARLALIREAGCMIVVVAAFSGSKAADDLQSFEEDLLIADLDIVSGRVEKLRESTKKPRPNRDKELAELEALEPILAQLENGVSVRELKLTDAQSAAIRSFQLLTNKPRLVVVNVADEEADPDAHLAGLDDNVDAVAFSITLQMDLQTNEPGGTGTSSAVKWECNRLIKKNCCRPSWTFPDRCCFSPLEIRKFARG